MILAEVWTSRGDRLGNWTFVALPRVHERFALSADDGKNDWREILAVIHFAGSVGVKSTDKPDPADPPRVRIIIAD